MTEEQKAKMRENLKRAREIAAANGVPKIRWSLDEVNQVAKECHRRSPERHPGAILVKTAQEILPKDRQKKNPTFGIIKQIQARWREIDEAVDNHTETTRDTRDGMGIDRSLYEEEAPEETKNGNGKGHEPKIEGYKPPLAFPPRGFEPKSGPLAYSVVNNLISINQTALELKTLTGSELQQLTRNHLDAMRIRSLVIQANNSLTYFEELIRAASAF